MDHIQTTCWSIGWNLRRCRSTSPGKVMAINILLSIDRHAGTNGIMPHRSYVEV